MSYFNIVLNNIKKKFSSYLIYFISTIFAVTIFNIFCSIYYNPQFSQYRFGAGKMSVLFKASAIAVIIFSAIFVMYSNKFFVKTRKKEIAIYSLLGMRKSQIGMMMLYENIIMGILATACGVVLGVIFSRFFSMLLLYLMAAGTDVNFSIQWQAIVATVIAFMILFTLSSINAYSIIYRYKLVELLNASKEGERIPKYSVLGGIISVAMIVSGYIIALTMNVNEGGFKLLLPSFLVLLLVVVGTLLFFINFVPMIMVRIKNNQNVFYKTENVISISQIIYRMKDNSKTLSMIAVMVAITITMISATYSLYRGLEDTVQYYSPFSYMCKNITDDQFNEMVDIVKQTGEVNITATDRVSLIKAQGQNESYSVETTNKPGMIFDTYILSQSDYKSIIKDTNAKTEKGLSNIRTDFNMELADNECYFIDGNTTEKYCENLTGKTVNLAYANSTSKFNIAGVSLHKYLGTFDFYTKPTIVVSDAVYTKYLSQAKSDDVVSYAGLMFDKPMNSEKTVKALNSVIPENKAISAVGLKNISYIGFYRSAFQFYGAYVFIGMFIGILFLLASGSIMYYKQIIEAQEEIPRYDILKKTGMSRSEIEKSISKQLGIVFGISLLIGLLHSFFALLTYNRMMDIIGQETPTLLNALIVVVLYIISYYFFYVLSKNSYMRIVCKMET